MQAASLSVIRAAALGGHPQQKLAIAFTQFDQVKGVNLPGFAEKRAYVMASVTTEVALSSIRQQVYTDLHRIVERRSVQDHDDWRAAYDLRGQNSTFGRAQEINAIFEAGAPIAPTVINSVAAEFIQEMRRLVYQAIVANGGAGRRSWLVLAAAFWCGVDCLRGQIRLETGIVLRTGAQTNARSGTASWNRA
ncbi:hypothetical protein [Bradyrhizobium sp. USDA 4506]